MCSNIPAARAIIKYVFRKHAMSRELKGIYCVFRCLQTLKSYMAKYLYKKSLIKSNKG